MFVDSSELSFRTIVIDEEGIEHASELLVAS